MTGRYPFFREPDEVTLAVIGEEAAASDLNGAYQKPYAVLTRKRLYCKNEMGNFITDASAVRSAGKARWPGQNGLLWGAFVCLLLVAVLAFFLKNPWRGETKWMEQNAKSTISAYTALQDDIAQCEKNIKNADKAFRDAQSKLDEKRKIWQDEDYDQLLAEIVTIEDRLDQLQYGECLYDAEETVKAIRDWSEPLLYAFGYTEEETDTLRQNVSEYYGIEIESIPSSQDTMLISDLEQFLTVFRDQGYEEWVLSGNWDRWDGRLDFIRETYCRSFGHEANVPYWDFFYEAKYGAFNEDAQYIALDFLFRSCEQYLTVAQELPLNDEYILQGQLDYDRSRAEDAYDLSAEISALESSLSQGVEGYKASEEDRLTQLNSQLDQSRPAYRAAKTALTVNLLSRVALVVLLAGLVLLLILAALGRTFPAALAAWVAGAAGLFLLGSSAVSLIQLMLLYKYTTLFTWLTLAGLAVLLAAIVLSVAALLYARRRAVYRVDHATGSFQFTPRLYPASELKRFTAQVKALNAGGAPHG